MAKMYPKNINEYLPEDSERIVYLELKNQLPDSFDVFYSVKWTAYQKGKLIKSEADFIIASPDYGFLCLEVKGGNNIKVDENDKWRLTLHMVIEHLVVLHMIRRKKPCTTFKNYMEK